MAFRRTGSSAPDEFSRRIMDSPEAKHNIHTMFEQHTNGRTSAGTKAHAPAKARSFGSILILLLLVAAQGPAIADSYSWIGGEAGNWNDASNWVPSGVPSFFDTVYVDLNAVTGGGTGITLLATRQIGHLEVSGSCPFPFRIGGGVFTGIQIVDGDFLAQPGMDLDELFLQFRGGENRLRSAGNTIETVSANTESIVSLEDDLTVLQSLQFSGATLSMQGHNLTSPDVLLGGSTAVDTVLINANGSTINVIDGAFGGPTLRMSAWFDLDGATVYTGAFEFDGEGSLGSAQIHCDRFFTSFSLSAADLDPGTSTLYVRYRDGGTSVDDELVQVRDGRLNRVVFEADSFTAFSLMGDSINEVVIGPGVVFDRLRIKDWRFGSGSLYIETLEVAEGAVVQSPFSFDISLNLGNVDVCTDAVTFQNFAVNGVASYQAGAGSTDLGGNTGWSFTDCTTTTPCTDAPDGLLALNGPGGVTLSWNAIPDATAYRVRGRPLGSTAWRFLPGIVAPGPSPSALAPASVLSAGTYEWQVVAACSPDYSLRSPFSSTATFFWPGPRLSGETAPGISVYPQPASDRVMLEGLVLEQPFQIINSTGQLVHQSRVHGTEALQLDVADWPAGLYYLVQGQQFQKLVLAR